MIFFVSLNFWLFLLNSYPKLVGLGVKTQCKCETFFGDFEHCDFRREITGFKIQLHGFGSLPWFCRKCSSTIVNCRYFCWSREEGGASAPFLLLCSSPASLEKLSSWRSRSLSIIKQWMLQWGSWRTQTVRKCRKSIVTAITWLPTKL